MKIYMFREVPLSVIRSFSLYTQQWCMSYRLCWPLVSRSICSCSQAVSKPVWHIPLLCVQWKTPNDGQRNFPKLVDFHSKNKFEKLVHLVGFILRNLSRCTVTWTSKMYMHVLDDIKIDGIEFVDVVCIHVVQDTDFCWFSMNMTFSCRVPWNAENW